jgi:hypothetical protein
MAYSNFANNSGAAPPPSRTNIGAMPGGDFSLSPAPLAPILDPSQTTASGAAPFPEPPSRSSGNKSVNRADPSQSTGDRGPDKILSDATPDNLWTPGADYAANGHHEFPQAHYKGMPPETRKVFDEAKTGRLFLRSLDGRRHEFDVFHREYNAATGELLQRFMEESNIAKRPDLLTPDHARAVLKLIAESEDPRIQTYRNFMRLFRMFPWLRGGGRGIE